MFCFYVCSSLWLCKSIDNAVSANGRISIFRARVICVSRLGPLGGTSRRAIFDFVAIAVPLLSYTI